MKRREFFGALALTLTGCADMAGKGGALAPWHMWGTTKQVRLTGVALVSSSVSSSQLVRVNYARPDTWRFFFWAELQSISAPSPVAVAVDFFVIFGVGRSAIKMGNGTTPFARLEFAAAELLPGTNPWRAATQVEVQPARASDTGPNLIQWIPGQDIQIGASVSSEGSLNAGTLLDMQVGAFLSPNVHIRPEWYADRQDSRWRGDEQGGT